MDESIESRPSSLAPLESTKEYVKDAPASGSEADIVAMLETPSAISLISVVAIDGDSFTSIISNE